MNFKEISTIYKYLKNNKHDIIRNNNYIEIITFNITFKCEYILIYQIINKNIIWSCDNVFMDKNTRLISKQIKDNINIETDDFIKVATQINKLIKNGDINNEMLFLCSNEIDNIIYYYIITDIINIF